MKFRNSLYALAIAGACSVSISAQTLTYTFAEVSGDVVLTVTGSLNDLTAGGSGWSFYANSQANQNDVFQNGGVPGGMISIYNSTDSGPNVANWYGHSPISPDYIGSLTTGTVVASGGSTTGDSIFFLTGNVSPSVNA